MPKANIPMDADGFPKDFEGLKAALQDIPPEYPASDSEFDEVSDDNAKPVVESSNRPRSFEDLYIAVMGVTGAGKSSFIELCTGQKGLKRDHLTSYTQVVEEYSFMYKDKDGNDIRVHLIDTPGFDDTNRGDTAVLKDIATWLGETYKREIRLSGVLYLHPIIDVRMAGSAKRNLLMFIELCGPDCFEHVVLATTMWSIVKDRTDAERREKEMIQTFWGHMWNKGSQVARHEGGRRSALAILDIIIAKRRRITLQIQHEMVENGMQLDQTAAGQQLDKDIQVERAKHSREMQELDRQKKKALEKHDEVARAQTAELQQDLQAMIAESKAASIGLKADFEKLQKERAAEMEDLKNKHNENVRQLEVRTKELQDREGMSNHLHTEIADEA